MRNPFSAVGALVLLAHQTAKRSRHSFDEVSKFEGASSTSVPGGKRAYALAAVRHQKSAPRVSAQGQTQSDVNGQENPGQGVGATICISQVPTEIQKSRNQKRQHGMCAFVFRKGSSRKHRLHQDATSLKILAPKHRETDCCLRWKKMAT